MCDASYRTGCNCAAFIPLPATWTMARPGIPASRPTLRHSSCIPGNPGLDYGPAATNIRHAAAINGTWELPFKDGLLANPLAKEALGGWSVSGIATLQSGFPLSPQLGYNPTGNGDTRNPVRPNLAPGFHGPLYAKKVAQWFNPAAFTAPYPGTFGNVGRDTLTGPGLSELDLPWSRTRPSMSGFTRNFVRSSSTC